jgi:ribosomal protein S18 acetylase RimI-like enzyme
MMSYDTIASNNYLIRAATLDDVQELSELAITVNRETYGHVLESEHLDTYCNINFNPGVLRQNLFFSKVPKLSYVAEAAVTNAGTNNEKSKKRMIIGYAVIEKKQEWPFFHPCCHDPPLAFLDKLYLRQMYHGIGLGKKLLEFALHQAKHILQCDSCCLTVLAANQAAISFYEKRGFTLSGKFLFPLVSGKHYCEDIVMIKSLI